MRSITLVVLLFLSLLTSGPAFAHKQLITGKQVVCLHWSDLNKIITAEKHGEDGALVFAETPSCDTMKFRLRMGKIYNWLIKDGRKFAAVKAWSITGVRRPFYLMIQVNQKKPFMFVSPEQQPEIPADIPNIDPDDLVPKANCNEDACLS